MFENLTDRLEGVFKKLRGHGMLTEENIKEAMREVRMALLEADVNYQVARDFVDGGHRQGGRPGGFSETVSRPAGYQDRS